MRRRHAIALAVAAVSGGTVVPTLAQPRDEHGGPEHREGREPVRRELPVQADRGRGQWEREMREPEHVGARGPEWHRGGHIPAEYRDHAYVVSDWRTHRLPAPPHGYQWVQVGPDYVLVAVRTGVIARIIVMG